MAGSVQAAETVENAESQTKIRDAAKRAISLLEIASAETAENRTCFTCHGQALPVIVFAEAQERGFEIDEANHQRQIDHTAAHLKRGQKNYQKGKGQGGRFDMAGYALWTLEVEGYQQDETTAAVTTYLIKGQSADGRWRHSSLRPPSEASDFTTTYVALRGLTEFATPEQDAQVEACTAAASKWILGTIPSDTEDRVFQLRALKYTNASDDTRQKLADELIAFQRHDGGWAQKEGMTSDAYATGSVLTSLARTGLVATQSEVYLRGIQYLLKTQKADGSWHVNSRSKPFQKYFETGFPYEKDQFISTSATAWATIALLLAVPKNGELIEEDDATLTLLESRKIWDAAAHNAFTDLLRHNDRWYCVFREGKAHVSPDGALRVLTSKDGERWESLALIESSKYDLRDAKLVVTPSGELMLNGAGMIADAEVRYTSFSWFSKDDGKTWSKEYTIGDPGFWLWRAHWHQGKVYSMGYDTQRDRAKRTLRFYRSEDGRKFETLVEKVSAPVGCGEDTILFLEDGSALCLLRHETGNKLAQLGVSKPPYTDWSWRDTNHRIGGPNMIQLSDGRILAAVRLYDGGTRTSLCWLDPKTAQLTEALKLPSGGDTSYPGLVMHDGVLWVSYYSSHEGKTSIYLAKIRIGEE